MVLDFFQSTYEAAATRGDGIARRSSAGNARNNSQLALSPHNMYDMFDPAVGYA